MSLLLGACGLLIRDYPRVCDPREIKSRCQQRAFIRGGRACESITQLPRVHHLER